MAIKDKVVVITGASSGIGEATAKLLASKGAKVVLGARNRDKLQKITDEIEDNGGQAVFGVTDVSKKEDNEALIKLAKDTFGKVDVVFLNAGIMPVTTLSALEVDRWMQTIDINLKGVLYGIAAVMPEFKAQHGGQVIATSSVAGLQAYPGCAAYSASKFGVRAVMDTLRMESAQEKLNIRTTTIYPGATATGLYKNSGNTTAGPNFASMSPEKVAEAVYRVIDLPEDTSVSDLTIGAVNQNW
ncbi:SDR family oxidoreductase [uncultured Lactobacillus sp.]|uniref:SDR family oxidoreductase n=1 Tax=uncultured Lactobacillus sp. TaxID=153152 RepID=UPI0028061549|nr:SDR family oxidoreductase [uncultured Lactobacillus sp.]